MTEPEKLIWAAAFANAMGEGGWNMPTDLFAMENAHVCVKVFRELPDRTRRSASTRTRVLAVKR